MHRDGLSWRFRDAVVRAPGASVANGLRAVDHGAPDPALFAAEHETYVRALEAAGLNVTTLPPLEEFPDSVFIEDTALCLPEGSIIMRPGAPSRAGEAMATAAALKRLGHTLHYLDADASADGGDILITDKMILVGLSARTNRAAYRCLRDLLGRFAYVVEVAETPPQVLHLKSDCCVLDGGTILATERLSKADCFRQFSVLTVPLGEEAAANSIRVNDRVLVPAGFPATGELLDRAGFTVEQVTVSQAALLDGGLSCLSLRVGQAPR